MGHTVRVKVFNDNVTSNVSTNNMYICMGIFALMKTCCLSKYKSLFNKNFNYNLILRILSLYFVCWDTPLTFKLADIWRLTHSFYFVNVLYLNNGNVFLTQGFSVSSFFHVISPPPSGIMDILLTPEKEKQVQSYRPYICILLSVLNPPYKT